jgi:hypothetical protein
LERNHLRSSSWPATYYFATAFDVKQEQEPEREHEQEPEPQQEPELEMGQLEVPSLDLISSD